MSVQNIQQPYLPLPQNTVPADNTQAQAGVSGTSSVGLTPAQQAAAVASQSGSLPAQSTVAAQAGQPELPDVQGASRSSASTDAAAGTSIAWLQLKPFNLSASLSQLGDAARDNALSAGNIRRIASQNEFSAQNASAAAQLAEVAGERKSAGIQFVGAVAGAAVSVGAGFLGARGSILGKGVGAGGVNPEVAAAQKTAGKTVQATEEQSANIQGAALTAGGAALGQLVTQSFSISDKLAGGGHDADEAKIAKAMQDVLVAAYKSRDDEFSSDQTNAQQSLGNVLSDLRKEINTNTNDTNRNIIQNT